LEKVDFTKTIAFHYGEPPLRVDFLTGMQGLDFDECNKQADLLTLDKNHKIPVLDYESLVINKMLAGRPKDNADLDELKKIIKLKKG
jgi:hypothetical protein